MARTCSFGVHRRHCSAAGSRTLSNDSLPDTRGDTGLNASPRSNPSGGAELSNPFYRIPPLKYRRITARIKKEEKRKQNSIVVTVRVEYRCAYWKEIRSGESQMKLVHSFLSITLLTVSSAYLSSPAAAQGEKECRGLPSLSFVQEPSSKIDPESAAGGGMAMPESDVVRIETDLVISELVVRDKYGHRVNGLLKEDFQIEEDGIRQDIEVFSFGRAARGFGRSIILIIDHSQSQTPYIATSIDAAKVLVDLLEPEDRMAVVTDDVLLLENFTSDKAKLKLRLESLRSKALDGIFGKSRQLSALYAAISGLFASADKRPIVILQTDGDENGALSSGWSLTQGGKCQGKSLDHAKLRSAIEKSGTTIYSIIPGVRLKDRRESERFELVRAELANIIDQRTKSTRGVQGGSTPEISDRFVRNWLKARVRDTAAIEELAKDTGGTFQYLESPQRAAEVYQSILGEMNQRYVVGYYPTNKFRDGKKRSISVSFRSGLKYSVVGKTSYLAPVDTKNR